MTKNAYRVAHDAIQALMSRCIRDMFDPLVHVRPLSVCQTKKENDQYLLTRPKLHPRQ